MSFKLNEATHVNPCGYLKAGEWYYCSGTETFQMHPHWSNPSSADIPIADLCPEGYTGDPSEKRLDDLKRDLDKHNELFLHYDFFAVNADGFCHYTKARVNDNYHPMPTTRGTVDDNKVTVENMIEHDAKAWDGVGLPPVGCVADGVMPSWGETRRCRVIAHDNRSCVVVYGHTDNPYSWTVLAWCDTFLPIRTDREKAIQDMLEALESTYHTHQCPDEEAALSVIDVLDKGLITGYGKLEK